MPSPTPLFFFNKDGSENVARKFNLLSFKLYRVFLHPLKLSNLSDFSVVELNFEGLCSAVEKREENSSSLYVQVLHKRRNRALDLKEMY